jgi:hypothetical protein
MGQGSDVVLQSNTFTVPPRCASCGMPQQTTRTTKLSKKQGRTTTTRSFQIPYCNPCADRAKGTQVKGALFAVATLGIVLAFSAFELLVPGLPAALLVGLPIVLSLGFAIAAMTTLAPKPPPLPAVATGDAVRLVKFNGNQSWLHCAHPQWADEFARANGTQPIQKSRTHVFGSGSLWMAILTGPIAAIGLWFLGHPEVRVDNAGAEAVQVWVDGKPGIVAEPNPTGSNPPSFYIGRGKHTYGRSKVGASAPEATVDADTTMMDAHLYNPSKTACYWLVADSYGNASVMGMQRGPQPIQEFYTFDKVDTWFGDNPQSIEVDSHASGGTRVALQRAKMCMELAEHGCSDADRETFVSCERAAKDETGLDACAKAVTCGNAKPSVAQSKGTTPASHSSAHTTPAPRPVGPHIPPAKTK